ncbi:hypothetical protein C5167_030811 [Papaver somniferum]|nr:hypothetical protein C5167_030811 [Papaver somniferum]
MKTTFHRFHFFLLLLQKRAENFPKEIRFILLQNRQGKTRLAKYYVPLEESQKHKVEYEHVRVLDLDEDVEEFPFRLDGLLCDDYENYHKTSVKHHLNRIWTIPSADFKLAKPYIQGMVENLNLFVMMFKKKEELYLAVAAKPSMIFGNLFAIQPLGNLESDFDLVWDKTLMPVQIIIPHALINKGKDREILEQLGRVVTVEFQMGNFYEVKVMVPLKSPMTKKVRCTEIQRRIFVRALPAPAAKATHVALTKIGDSMEKGDSSGAGGISASNDRPAQSSKTFVVSVSLHPVGAMRTSASTSLPVVSSFFPPLPSSTYLSLRESASSSVSSSIVPISVTLSIPSTLSSPIESGIPFDPASLALDSLEDFENEVNLMMIDAMDPMDAPMALAAHNRLDPPTRPTPVEKYPYPNRPT